VTSVRVVLGVQDGGLGRIDLFLRQRLAILCGFTLKRPALLQTREGDDDQGQVISFFSF